MDKTILTSKELRLPPSSSADKSIIEFLSRHADNINNAIIRGQMSNEITVINTAINRGIVFHCDRMEEDLSLWRDLLLGGVYRLLGQEYALDHGYITSDGTKEDYWIYIKPSLRLRAQLPVKQLFGNLFFELSIIDGQATKWQLLSNVYHGRTYQEALSLEDLVEAMWWSKVE